MMLIIYFPLEYGKYIIFIILFIATHTIIRLITFEISSEAIFTDLQYTTRSILMIVGIVMFLCCIEVERVNELFRKFFPVQWIFITCAVLANIVFDFGEVYKTRIPTVLREGFHSFFQSGNQIAIIYSVSWWVLAMRFKSLMVRSMLTVISVAILLAMGSKAGAAIIVGMVGLATYKKIYDYSKGTFAFTCIISLVIGGYILLNFEETVSVIANLFLNYSGESSQLQKKVRMLGAFSGMVSQRDVFVADALDIISKYDLRQIIFGANFYAYSKAMGTYITKGPINTAEVDPIDLLGGFGILGLLLAYVPLFITAILLFKRQKYADEAAKKLHNDNLPATLYGIFIIMLIFSCLTGHVFLCPLSMACLGLAYGITYHLISTKPLRSNRILRKHENPLYQ